MPITSTAQHIRGVKVAGYRGTNPRAPMGPADRVPFGSAGARVARRADRGKAHEQFTQVRAARMRKTLLLLCGLY